MSKIIIERPNDFGTWGRKYLIYIDNVKVGQIKSSEIKEFDIASGKHIISVETGFYSSQDLVIEVDNNEEKKLKVRVFKYGNYILPLVALTPLLFVYLSRYYNLTVYIFLFIFLITFMIVMRNKYLVLHEIAQ